MAAEALPDLVARLKAGDAKCAARLADIAIGDATMCSRVMEAGALPPIVALLQTGTDDAKAHAARALRGITCEDGLRARVVEAGALPPLVALLQMGTDAAKENAACAVANIACDDALCARVVEAGSLPPLVALLQASTDAAKELAALALRNLASEAALCARLVEAGALPSLVALLQMGTDSAKENAAHALANIACDDALGARVVEAGALPPLVALLQMGTDDGREYAALALADMTREATLCAHVVDAGALPLLVALLQTGTGGARENAALALGNMVGDTWLRTRVVEAGAVPPLVALLQAGSEKAKEHAVWALYILAREPRLRDGIIGCGAVLHLAALSADPLTTGDAKRFAQGALDLLCATTRSLQRAVGESVASVLPPLRAQLAAAEARAREMQALVDARASELRALADDAGGAGAAHCDVTLRCADGEELGASRFLLAQTSSYYRALFEAGSAEAASGVVAADPDFSSAAHSALLRQLHSLGEAPLPEEADAVLELLKLAAKLQPSAGGSAEQPAPVGGAVAPGPPLQRVVARCEAAVLGGLDVSNCLDMLLHVKAGGSFPRIVEAAECLVKERLPEVVAQPRWAHFAAEFPSDALELMQATAVRMWRDLDGHDQSKRQRLG